MQLSARCFSHRVENVDPCADCCVAAVVCVALPSCSGRVMSVRVFHTQLFGCISTCSSCEAVRRMTADKKPENRIKGATSSASVQHAGKQLSCLKTGINPKAPVAHV
ncbi:uncharacterized protein V6R79_004977 [Siganus canaliculatus]